MLMRWIIVGFAGVSLSIAQIEEGEVSPMSPKEEALEELLSERESKEALEKAEAKAREVGLSEQAILEARFLFHVDRAEDTEIAAMLPQFVERKKKFVLAESEIFASEDDWLAVIEYVHAIAAIGKGDKEGFKKHITEAFWLSPQQGAVFAPHIERVRLEDAMKDVQVEMTSAFKSIMDESNASLGETLGERKGLLLYFWSPHSQECELTLGDFFLTASHLIEKNVAVASILPETSDKIIGDAKKMLTETEKEIPGAWMVDDKEKPISTLLHVRNVPVVVLISNQGRVLYNGHPTEEQFWKMLAVLNAEIERPEIAEDE
jgi:hypothetical protein